ncbi:hypothetical protein [Thermoanaerobacter sp. RKWS2]|uniref:hypothetical protein n=1 Tax=Thermoanaerobacter sp. RKWS2 TaxID=2983842 RepID=UPI00224B9CD3|nr:hypothetical protein [Thermoanaerobacter sp. RKWS2]UZQ83414.1 hypothetical protein OEI98_000460 [Thermoanaerobacter sp. RKWS2]
MSENKGGKNLKRALFWVLLMVFVVVALIGYDYYNYNRSHPFLYNTNKAPDLNYSTQSKNFKIYTLIEVGKKYQFSGNETSEWAKNAKEAQESNKYTSLQYTIIIKNISDKVIRDFKAQAFVDEGLQPYIMSGILYFGTLNQQKIDLNVKNNEKMDYMTEISRFTWLPNINQIDVKDREKILEAIKKPIKLIIKWRDGEEYLLLENAEVKIY